MSASMLNPDLGPDAGEKSQRIAVYYDPRQSVPGLEDSAPSAGKPARFMERLQGEGLAVNLRPVTPATRADLLRVHDAGYVDGVFAGTTLNGLQNNEPRVAESCLWTVGSLVTAALAARLDDRPACSPTSGFHHAGHRWGGGFCTFNGLLVAASRYIEANPGAVVGILDCDAHFGDGTEDILKRMPELACQVLHRCSASHFSKGMHPIRFFGWLRRTIAEFNAAGCALMLYQASADMHIDDPLGGLLDSAQLRERDRLVFEGLRAPVVWNLAGGYRGGGEVMTCPVLGDHVATLRAAMRDVGRP
jgi:acetoin utilization deacetylase AcuC-like enzyme